MNFLLSRILSIFIITRYIAFGFRFIKYKKPINLNRFFEIDKNVLDASVEKFCIRYPDNEYAISARDGAHFGEAYHEFWANIYYSLYKQGS